MVEVKFRRWLVLPSYSLPEATAAARILRGARLRLDGRARAARRAGPAAHTMQL